MGLTEERLVLLKGQPTAYTLERKAVKNLNLRVGRDGSIRASAAPEVSGLEVDRFVRGQADFVLRALSRQAERRERRPEPLTLITGESIWLLGDQLPLRVVQGPKGGMVRDGQGLTLTARDPENLAQKQRILGKFWDGLCREVFQEALDRLLPRLTEYHGPAPVLHIRNTTSRWGSCVKARASVSLSKRLLQAPPDCVDMVVMHELCHLVQANHSARFYALLDRTYPGWQAQRELLKRSSAVWMCKEDV